jgi:exodeoxyribonuclease VII large subunit
MCRGFGAEHCVPARCDTREVQGDVLTVSEITSAVAELLGEAFPRVAVRGQISNLRRQSSGHLYFSLKDEGAQLVCAMWRSSADKLKFRPEDGQEVVASGRIEVYPPHGKYQLIVSSLAPMGLGDLHVKFEELKKKLAAEGLFAPERKRALPLWPRRVAVITSPTSAAIRDFLRIAYRRMPGAWITVFPVRVQGEDAWKEVAAALAAVPRLGEFDAVVVGRGGGSIEDLWAFNEEGVARAIVASPVPVVSAVGHETDTTIADFAADVRAATPSEAAEIVFPDVEALAAQIADGRQRLTGAVVQRMEQARETLTRVAHHRALAEPAQRLRRIAQDLDQWEERAMLALSRRVERSRERLARVAAHLDAVSPLAVLSRGYSITFRDEAGRDGRREALRGVEGVAAGDRIVSRLASGSLVSEVVDVRPEER